MQNKTRFRIMPTETYVVTVGNHNEEISGLDILTILEAAFDEAQEADEMRNFLDKIEEIDYSDES
jgi:hypothetical protein